MKNVLAFLNELQYHNDREWFEANKARYRSVRAEFDGFVDRLIASIAGFDPSVAHLKARDCTYRIYRDTRFSPDKTPYKTHLSALIAPGGKKSGYSGYYFHVEPRGEGMIGHPYLSTGIYMPGADVLKSIREEICDNPETFLKALKKARGFRMEQESKLKRMPAGFDPDPSVAEFIKLKDLYIGQDVDEHFMLQPDLLKATISQFKTTFEFNSFLNKAIRYAFQEE